MLGNIQRGQARTFLPRLRKNIAYADRLSGLPSPDGNLTQRISRHLQRSVINLLWELESKGKTTLNRARVLGKIERAAITRQEGPITLSQQIANIH
jgi:hypothetical protein